MFNKVTAVTDVPVLHTELTTLKENVDDLYEMWDNTEYVILRAQLKDAVEVQYPELNRLIEIRADWSPNYVSFKGAVKHLDELYQHYLRKVSSLYVDILRQQVQGVKERMEFLTKEALTNWSVKSSKPIDNLVNYQLLQLQLESRIRELTKLDAGPVFVSQSEMELAIKMSLAYNKK